MGFFRRMSEKVLEELGTTSLHLTMQRNQSWAKMHRKNFEKYLGFRGYAFTPEVAQIFKIALSTTPEMTYREFVDCYLED